MKKQDLKIKELELKVEELELKVKELEMRAPNYPPYYITCDGTGDMLFSVRNKQGESLMEIKG